MLAPDLELTIANWMLFGKQVRDLVKSIRHGELAFTPEAARVLDDAVTTFDRVGNDIVDALLVGHRSGGAHDEAPRPAAPPRMIHDMPAVYQPDAQRGRLQDMARVAAASNVVPLRPAPKGGAK